MNGLERGACTTAWMDGGIFISMMIVRAHPHENMDSMVFNWAVNETISIELHLFNLFVLSN